MNRYQNIPINSGGYYNTTVYPEIPLNDNDIYLITTQGDRFDILAYQYYKDTSLWWIIASANPGVNRDSLTITPGLQVRIPADKAKVISLFRELNTNR